MSRAHRSRSLVAVLVVAAAFGCGVSVEGELPDVEVTQRDVKLPGLPAEAVIGEGGLTFSVTQSHDKLGLSPDGYSEIRVREVALAAKTGIVDLSFIRALKISVAPADQYAAGVAPTEIARYERTTTDVGTALRIPNVVPVNVIDAWRARSTVVVFEIAGDLPEEAWTIDFGVRYAAKLNLSK